MEIENNPNNPTITVKGKMVCANHFLIKYKNNEERVSMAEKVLKLVKYHELDDFHIEEKPAFQETKIMYNSHTIVKGASFSQEELERNFLKYFN